MDAELEKEIKSIIDEIDKNGDQEIDLEQFIKCVNGLNQDKTKEKKDKKTKKMVFTPQPKPSEPIQEVSSKRQLRSAIKESNDDYC